MSMNGYICISCAASRPADFDGFVCPQCGANLDITYDYDKIRAAGGEFAGDHREGIFRYGALLPVPRPRAGFPLRIGRTPLVEAPRLAASAGLGHVYLKDDGLNPSASFKDRATAVAILHAMGRGAGRVAAASTGNAGSSLACLSAGMGLACTIFVPESAPRAKIAQLMIFGAQVLAVRGGYDDAFDLCLEACREFGWYNRSTGVNPFTREGKKTCAFEIWEDLGRTVPDRVVVATGDGNIISGIWKGWRDLRALGWIDRLPRIDCAQATGSAAIANAVHQVRADHSTPTNIDWSGVTVAPVKSSTLADSIAVDLPRDGLAAVRAVIESDGEAVPVSDAAILAAEMDIARLAGVFAEPSAAATWAAVQQMAESGRVDPGERIVCVVSGNGLKDAERACDVAGEPILIDPSLADVRRVVAAT